MRCRWHCGRGSGGPTCGWVVAGLGVGVVAGPARDRDERGGGWRGGAAGGGRVGQAGRGAPAGEAGVSGGGAVGVQRGDAPAGAGMARGGGGQVAGVVAVQQAEPAGFAGRVGPALVGGPGDGEGDQRREARPGARARAGRRTGTARAIPVGSAAKQVAVRRIAAAPQRGAARGRPSRRCRNAPGTGARAPAAGRRPSACGPRRGPAAGPACARRSAAPRRSSPAPVRPTSRRPWRHPPY